MAEPTLREIVVVTTDGTKFHHVAATGLVRVVTPQGGTVVLPLAALRDFQAALREFLAALDGPPLALYDAERGAAGRADYAAGKTRPFEGFNREQ